MARKTAIITISAEGRDKDKMFYIQEMPAMKAERWATRALLALVKGGAEIPDDVATSGLAGLKAIGIKALMGLQYEDAEPLLNEMLGCVSIIPDPNNRDFMRSDIESDIEEVKTLLTLRAAVFNLHSDFSMPVVTSTSTSTTGKMGRKSSRSM